MGMRSNIDSVVCIRTSFREISDFDCIIISQKGMSLDLDQSLVWLLDHHRRQHMNKCMEKPHESIDSNLLRNRGRSGHTDEEIRSLLSREALPSRRRRRQMASHSTTPNTDYQPRFSIAIYLLKFGVVSIIFKTK